MLNSVIFVYDNKYTPWIIYYAKSVVGWTMMMSP